MNKPDDIPQDAWDAAEQVDVEADFSYDGQTSGERERQETVENIARAIMAARLQERDAIIKLIDDVAEQEGSDFGLVKALRNRKP